MAYFDFLASHAESTPTKPAVILGDQTLDFATLNRRANRAANLFKDLGCEAGDRVAYMSFNSVAGFEIANGIRRSGTVVVPVNYRLRGPEIAYLLSDSSAKVVVASKYPVDAELKPQPQHCVVVDRCGLMHDDMLQRCGPLSVRAATTDL